MTKPYERCLRSFLPLCFAVCQIFLYSPRLASAPAGGISRVTVTFYGGASYGRGFTWYTDEASAASDLQVVRKTGETPDFDKASVFRGVSSRPTRSSDTGPETFHKAEASGLRPGASYYYRVGDASLGLWSAPGVFYAPEERGAFTFIDMADPQCSDESECALSADTIARAFAEAGGAGFLALNGDIVNDGGNESQWKWLLGSAEKSLMRTTLLPIAGNHDRTKNAFIEHFNVKTPSGSAVESGAYYSVDYGNAHFIALNSNENSGGYANLSPEQARWLLEDAALARSRGAEWIIALIHEGPYTIGPHATDKEIAGPEGSRRKIAPLLAKAGVDLVLQGHDHIYSRSKPIAADGSPVKPSKAPNGKEAGYAADPGAPVYLVPGSAGKKTYYRNKQAPSGYFGLFEAADENRAAAHGPDKKYPKNPVQGLVQHFTVITVDGLRLSAVSYEIDRTRSGGAPYVIDRFGIVKGASGGH